MRYNTIVVIVAVDCDYNYDYFPSTFPHNSFHRIPDSFIFLLLFSFSWYYEIRKSIRVSLLEFDCCLNEFSLFPIFFPLISYIFYFYCIKLYIETFFAFKGVIGIKYLLQILIYVLQIHFVYFVVLNNSFVLRKLYFTSF